MFQIEEDDGGLPSEQGAFHQVPPSRPVVERPKAVHPQRPAAGQVIDRTPPPRKKDE